MTRTHAKDQGQRSAGSKDRMEMDGQIDGGNCITSRANIVGKYWDSCLNCHKLAFARCNSVI